MRKMILEACIETLEEAILAEKKGANRIELCSNLDVGGTSPSKHLIKTVSEAVNIPVMVMIRPRGGNFVYSADEIEQMKSKIKECKKLNVQGVVLGCLRSNNTVDTDITSILSKLAHPLKVTFHKAIDESNDILLAVDELMSIKEITGILSSGAKKTAAEGKEILKSMVQKSEQIEIIVAGKVQTGNINLLHDYINAKAYHGRKIV
jgi:copper homeostasis protein